MENVEPVDCLDPPDSPEFLGFDKECIEFASQYNIDYRRFITTYNTDSSTLANGYPDSEDPKSEYAQYLGLQPTIKFRCIKCQNCNFQTLEDLNMHLPICKEQQPVPINLNPDTTITPILTPKTNFKITRRVYLCSACGVYFEIWKLFLHMRTAHRRYICLICLGLFSIAEKLSNHLIVKHSILPKNYQLNLNKFYQDYGGKGASANGSEGGGEFYLMCCHCEQMFNENDAFVDHVCDDKSGKEGSVSGVERGKIMSPKKKIMPNEHVTADTCDDKVNGVNGDEEEEEILEDKKVEIEEEKYGEEPMDVEDDFVEPKIIEDEKVASPQNNDLPEPVEKVATPPPPPAAIEQPKIESQPMEIEDPLPPTTPPTTHPIIKSPPKPSPMDDTRKVPKVTLRLPILPPPSSIHQMESGTDSDSSSDSSDSCKLTVTTDDNEQISGIPVSGLLCADVSVPIMELGLRPSLNERPIEELLKDLIRASCGTCVYCNYARKIAVNGKQLALHMIAEHRFAATADSITEEELVPESFNKFIESNLETLSQMCFNLESFDSVKGMVPYDRTYECFQCRFVTTIHKELYLHNRKMHPKTLLLCIMCKSTFYSYSELLCHLCPGVYLNTTTPLIFRCCLCPLTPNIPSAFRLMVHLRKRHHACDVCLETCTTQSKLSNHVWKHKLHHLCYRCGISYRNKPDITKHLFWKHGTESVLCKKCLQKKWPHVYHFCIPPLTFQCDECTGVFTKAVALKVHKRLHSGVKPYKCTEEGCDLMFISKRLVEKHVQAHRGQGIVELENEPEEEEEVPVIPEVEEKNITVDEEAKVVEIIPPKEDIIEAKPKAVVDVYDLPALNLSESDSDSDDESPTKPMETSETTDETNEPAQPVPLGDSVEQPAGPLPPTTEEPAIVDGIWDNFKNYKASIGQELTPEVIEPQTVPEEKEPVEEPTIKLLEIIRNDHDYCCPDPEETQDKLAAETPTVEVVKGEGESSSSDSDSTSCSCGSNCSCSTSSGSSSSSSSSSDSETEETPRGSSQQPPPPKEVVVEKVVKPKPPPELPIMESDLYTTESETDEDFYDESPQMLALQKIEKVEPTLPRVVTPPIIPEPVKIKKKKRKKAKRELLPVIIPPPIMTSSIQHRPAPVRVDRSSGSETDSALRLSKRRRVPNKFYGYTSDDDTQIRLKPPEPPQLEWNKEDLPEPTPIAPVVIQSKPPPSPHVMTIKISTPTIPMQRSDTSSDSDSDDNRLMIARVPTPPPVIPPPQHMAPPPQTPVLIPPVIIPVPSPGTFHQQQGFHHQPPRTSVNLYCYCQCPYDEVSEMIACDGKKCAIEWFHFECVGIMVPPKGKWFCPDCRKQSGGGSVGGGSGIGLMQGLIQRPEYFMSQ